MKHQFRTFMMTVVCLMITANISFAQIIPSISTGIVDALPFNPLGKFTAIGNSGGVIGPNVFGCDLYGFRAQNNFQAVNLGIETVGTLSFPALTFAGTGPLVIEQQFASGTGGGPLAPCGKVLALYFDSTPLPGNPLVNDIVYQVFGNATANGLLLTSDRKLKTNIKSLNNSLDLVRELNGVTYNWKQSKWYKTDKEQNLTLQLTTIWLFLF